ncbi:MAG: 5-carboxymethyl-2-hydroxymuconate Delta-isomerase [Anaerolineae bacterium]|nr:5-carboxymethyl-2-hydroxymuconate Delta-isomerase [Anaerolineae bacterium]
MPHLTLEYTDNLDFDVQRLLARLHDELVATGAVNLKGIKSRAIRHTEYRIADGDEGYAFVHVNLLIREGRPLEIQQDSTRRVMALLKDTFGYRFENGYLSLSVDLKEMREGVALTSHNIPAAGVGKTGET